MHYIAILLAALFFYSNPLQSSIAPDSLPIPVFLHPNRNSTLTLLDSAHTQLNGKIRFVTDRSIGFSLCTLEKEYMEFPVESIEFVQLSSNSQKSARLAGGFLGFFGGIGLMALIGKLTSKPKPSNAGKDLADLDIDINVGSIFAAILGSGLIGMGIGIAIGDNIASAGLKCSINGNREKLRKHRVKILKTLLEH